VTAAGVVVGCDRLPSAQEIAQALALRLAPQATSVRVAYAQDGWKILLEAEQIPDQRSCLDALGDLLTSSLLQPIDVYGRQLGGSQPGWGVRLRPKDVPAPEQFGQRSDRPYRTEPLLLAAGVAILFSVGAGLHWQSPSVWLEAAPAASPAQVRSVILNAAATLAPATPPLFRYVPPESFRGRVFNSVPLAAGQKLIALTFDDGPDPIYTTQVLDILAKENIKASFFAIAIAVAAYPELAQQIVQEGHTLANHSWSHRYHNYTPSAAMREVDHTQQYIEQVTGVNIKLFRPPGGRLNNGLASRATQQGYGVVMWSVDPQDWLPGQTSEQIATSVIRQAHPGGIVLLHDGGGNRAATVAALPKMIQDLRAKGYEFVTLPELLQASDPSGELHHPEWLTIQETAQLEVLAAKLEARCQALRAELIASSPLEPAQRHQIAAALKEQQQALSWVQQRLAFEIIAENRYQAAFAMGQQALTAAKAQEWAVVTHQLQGAIAELERIPERSFVYPLAQVKQREYKRLLDRTPNVTSSRR
jgi:peptidoglycan/xylan/chitin deacetylase (PgdA/CDA1 family)